MMRVSFLLLCMAFVINGQVLFPVITCPKDVHGMPDFDVAKYLGKWYEQEKYPHIFEIGGKCITAEYSSNDNGTVRVLNSQENVVTGMKSTIEGWAELTNKEGVAELSVHFPSLPVPIAAPYWVLDTDYTSYAVVWSCENVLINSARFLWILTRERMPSVETMQKAYAVLDKYHINKAFLLRTDQKKCPEDH